ncbi:NADPH-dependent FMN reductase [Lentilactobacillus kisonensis]|uniref:Flavin reductase n=1 Tax=Lentilactobacillus kisonensis F0435 TaxID=797516 RepID=H1LKB4_9LACO|nr:NAD(P)H-dependent oxidoreductase [Lentilactobacillus kisonensis]EHO47588.1 flavin reductase [Lentilactobacillus kisonensis F0435]
MPKKIGILVGSLRKGSYSKIVAKALATQFPAGYETTFIKIGSLPFFNQDLEETQTEPGDWQEFRMAAKQCDAFVFVTPEYNRSVPAVLKNAIDVGSRPRGQNVWDGKPALVVSVTNGATGAFGANHALRQSLVFLNMPTVQQPEAYIGGVTKHIDASGKITDPGELKYFHSLADALVTYLLKLE